jgi:transcriptional regulator with XRE-family HTH domain
VPTDLPDDEWLLEERRRIGRCIRVAREHRNLTQEQVFLAAAMNRSHYQQIEAGTANPSLDMLLRIARVIGVPIADLLRFTDVQATPE